jgi:hypothetical protein
MSPYRYNTKNRYNEDYKWPGLPTSMINTMAVTYNNYMIDKSNGQKNENIQGTAVDKYTSLIKT